MKGGYTCLLGSVHEIWVPHWADIIRSINVSHRTTELPGYLVGVSFNAHTLLSIVDREMDQDPIWHPKQSSTYCFMGQQLPFSAFLFREFSNSEGGI